MTDIIIIGAGPVGLKTAIEVKLRDPKLKILLIEQYPQYKRQHVLSIDKASFQGSYKEPHYQSLLKSCEGTVSTQFLENTLKDKALSLGIDIDYQKIDSCQAIASKYPEAKFIIGADGARSVVRQQVFKDQMKQKADLQYAGEMKYWVDGDTRPLKSITECPLALAKTSHLVIEHVGKPVDNRTPVTLRVFISQEEHHSLKQATFKSPYHWNNSDKGKIAPNVVKTLEHWISFREKVLGDRLNHTKTSITGLTLSSYASQNTVKNKYGKTWALVGDAAFGVPYFRSLNNGFLCADELAKQVVRHLKGKRDIERNTFLGFTMSEKTHSPLKQYQQYVDKLSDQEVLHAKIKAKSLDAVQIPLNASRKVVDSAQNIETKHVVAASAIMLTMYGMKRYYDSQKTTKDKPCAKRTSHKVILY